ncbi:MAG: hypothetical protein KC425_09400, partial [Anaerolineales bacterium]|nr:hypothetical protein [Anaerolineales bacterium]
ARAAGTVGWRRAVLRWFHGLTWLLLALAAGVAALTETAVSNFLALAALAVYGMFLFAIAGQDGDR